MATVCHLGFLKVRNFNCRYGTLRRIICAIVPNFEQIGQAVAEVWPNFYFQDVYLFLHYYRVTTA